jgi:hypothetical protein
MEAESADTEFVDMGGTTVHDNLNLNFKNVIIFALKYGNIILSDNSQQYFIQTIMIDSR